VAYCRVASQAQKAGLAISLMGELEMPTDILLSIEERRVAKKKEAADLRAYLLLVPLIICLVSILLGTESHAYACALTMLGLN
jgi:hypothetical protein